MDFYERVKYLVKKQNTTIQDLIESLGINFETYRGQKRHGNLPRADEAVRIAAALNTTVEYLVTGETSNTSEVELAQLKQKLLDLTKSG